MQIKEGYVCPRCGGHCLSPMVTSTNINTSTRTVSSFVGFECECGNKFKITTEEKLEQYYANRRKD